MNPARDRRNPSRASQRPSRRGKPGGAGDGTGTPPPGEGKRPTPAGEDPKSSRIIQAVQDVAAAAAAKRSPRAISASARLAGMSLAVKFALVITGVSAVLLLTTGIIILLYTRRAFDDKTDNRGKDLVVAVGELAASYKSQLETKRGELQTQFFGDKKPAADDPLMKELTRALNAYDRGLQEEYSKRLKGVAYIPGNNALVQSASVLNAFVSITKENRNSIVFSADKDVQTLQGSRMEINPRDSHNTPYVLLPGMKIYKQEGVLDRVPVRAFIREVGTGDGALTAYVIISTEQIESTKNKLLLITLILTLLAILVSILISFALASRVTKPVRRLVEDIAIVSSGNLAHRTIAVSNDEIGLLAASFDAMTENLHMAHEQELEHKAREHELSIATEIQSNLLPKKIPQYDGFDIGAFYQPSKEVGGDYYDFISIDEEHVGIVVADVSGKGVPGSLVMAMARLLLRMEAERNLSAADTFIKTNRILAKDIKRGMFVTAMYCILNIKTGVIQVASAGHNPMVVFRAAINKVSLVNPHGIALGFDKGPIFERTVKEEKIQLNPGDRIVMYTDGVVEAMSPDQKEFGEDRFHRLVQENGGKTSNQFINIVVEQLEAWRADGQQSDDITITTFKLL